MDSNALKLKVVGWQLLRYRAIFEINLEDAAKSAEITPEQLANIEAGTVKDIGLILAVATAYKLDFSNLFKKAEFLTKGVRPRSDEFLFDYVMMTLGAFSSLGNEPERVRELREQGELPGLDPMAVELGAKIRTKREQLGLSPADVALAIERPGTWVLDAERGAIDDMSQLRPLLEALNVEA